MIDENLSEAERDRTWVHEILSVYHYLKGILRHDEEIEKETQNICRDCQNTSFSKDIKEHPLAFFHS